MKNELGGKIMTDFATLRPKTLIPIDYYSIFQIK